MADSAEVLGVVDEMLLHGFSAVWAEQSIPPSAMIIFFPIPGPVKALFRYFVDLCLLRLGPQDMPASWPLFWLLIPVNLLLTLILAGDSFGTLFNALVAALLDLLMLLAWLRLLLMFKGYPLRYVQSATALLGSSVVLSLLAIPLSLVLGDTNPENMTAQQQTFSTLLLLLVIWSLVVTANIFRQALSVNFLLGMGLVLTYWVSSILLRSVLFPLEVG